MGTKRMMLTRIEDPAFDTLLRESAERFKALPSEERKRLLEAQGRSAGRSAFPRAERR